MKDKDNVISWDFGKSEREVFNLISRRIKLIGERNEEFKRNPSKFFKAMLDAFAERDLAVYDALNALNIEVVCTDNIEDYTPKIEMKTINVCEKEYKRLKKCAELLKQYPHGLPDLKKLYHAKQ